MDMTKEVYLFVWDDQECELVRVTPTNQEAYHGRRMAATINLMAREWVKTKKDVSMDTSLGTMVYKENLRGKKREATLTLYEGAFRYHELRQWIVLACQYLVGEYPLIVFDFRRETCRIMFDSNRSIALDVSGLSNTP